MKDFSCFVFYPLLLKFQGHTASLLGVSIQNRPKKKHKNGQFWPKTLILNSYKLFV